VAWGAYHGALLVAERAATALGLDRWAPTRPWLRQIITFHLVCFGWLLFRAQSIGDVPVLLANAFSFDLIVWRNVSQAAAALALGALVHVAIQPAAWHGRFGAMSPWLKGVAYAAAALLVCLSADAAGRFIYFQF
jgi:D-alanyl-lipoteichoic acid acyltransferase DltB (MBOAT superfamily)